MGEIQIDRCFKPKDFGEIKNAQLHIFFFIRILDIKQQLEPLNRLAIRATTGSGHQNTKKEHAKVLTRDLETFTLVARILLRFTFFYG